MISNEKLSKSVVEARISEYFKKLQATGQNLIVTDEGTPVLIIKGNKTKIVRESVFIGFPEGLKYPESLKDKEEVSTPSEDESKEIPPHEIH